MTPALISASMVNEVVASLPNPMFMALKQSLPRYIDDVERDLGVTVYETMLNDAQVASDFETLVLSVLSEGIRVAPAIDPVSSTRGTVDPKLKAEAETAALYAKFVERSFDRVKDGMLGVTYDLLRGIAYGHRVAEIVTEWGDGEDSGKMVLSAIKPKPRSNVGFVVDQVGNLIGMLAIQPGKGMTTLPEIWTYGETTAEQLLPVEKFLIWSNNTENSVVSGKSVLRPAYTAWFIKKNILPDWYKYLRQFGTPAVIGKTPEGKDTVNSVDKTTGEILLDSSSNPVLISAIWDLLQSLLAWQNSYALAVPGGTEIDLVESKGDGNAFDVATAYFNREISKAILGTAQLTQEAKHESRSSKDAGQDVVGLRVSWYRQRLGEVLKGLSKLLIGFNFGADQVRLAPNIVCSKAEQQDRGEMMKAYSTAKSAGLIHDSQLPGIWEELGLPEVDPEILEAERADRIEERRLATRHKSTLMDPAGDNEEEDA